MRPFVPILLSALLSPAVASAQFFSTAAPEDVIQVGVRAGLNTSTQTINRDMFPNWTSSGWGTGFHVGAEVPLGILDFLSIQPGFFYELRSGDYAVSSTVQTAQMGHYSMSYLSIPVTVQINFNINERLRWSVEAGPYFSWRIGSHHSSALVMPETISIETPDGPVEINPGTVDYPVGTLAKQKKDYGLKVGTFFLFDRHWYAGLHYNAGLTRVYKDKDLGGANQMWALTLGYNF
ncbi:MAG: PorT family protein [Bacteroides sp.]|nr:PorT family protein [Bacteroides sp.]